jgi:hypothetical protein
MNQLGVVWNDVIVGTYRKDPWSDVDVGSLTSTESS